MVRDETKIKKIEKRWKISPEKRYWEIANYADENKKWKSHYGLGILFCWVVVVAFVELEMKKKLCPQLGWYQSCSILFEIYQKFQISNAHWGLKQVLSFFMTVHQDINHPLSGWWEDGDSISFNGNWDIRVKNEKHERTHPHFDFGNVFVKKNIDTGPTTSPSLDDQPSLGTPRKQMDSGCPMLTS